MSVQSKVNCSLRFSHEVLWQWWQTLNSPFQLKSNWYRLCMCWENKIDRCLLYALEAGCFIEQVICIQTMSLPARLTCCMYKGCKARSLETKASAFVDKRINHSARGQDQEASERFVVLFDTLKKRLSSGVCHMSKGKGKCLKIRYFTPFSLNGK